MSATRDRVAALWREEAIAALVAEEGHRGRAAARLDVSLRTMHRLLSRLVGAAELAQLAAEHDWPDVCAAARAARAERRAQ